MESPHSFTRDFTPGCSLVTAPIANAIIEQWYEDKTLPTDKDQLKGTLFYLWRQSRFIDGFPDDDDVPFLQALVAAIEG